ncbi:S-layer homology domain-containing protein [Paenibacillus sp. DMB20]|uniref:S-layer homology domain-containing protein n=1 Tax=Paenibacillus sp. DMB20 TaxID=1642570 RepID=UPI00069B2348|nr:S-layer homology domain-containing protein [Paenibacillus sp. DMB20]
MLAFSLTVQTASAKEAAASAKSEGHAQAGLKFKDMDDAPWAEGYILKMQSKHVFQGFQDGTFRPNKPVTRVEAIVTAVRLMGLEDEAKSKPADAKLPFKDADHLSKKFPWAKGYVITALEQGLFDANENLIQPEKPASRVWVSSLLVKSLGFGDEALAQMTAKLSFKDANAIPAGSIGYVKLASEKGIVSGYPNGTFKPNKNVTRAEMAALLDRTNDGMLENAGAVKVNGIVKEISFPTVTGQTYGATVTGDTYGEIKVETVNQEVKTFSIQAGLMVGYHNKAIKADQLKVNDKVLLTVMDQKVVEAKLLGSNKPNEKPATNGKQQKRGKR